MPDTEQLETIILPNGMMMKKILEGLIDEQYTDAREKLIPRLTRLGDHAINGPLFVQIVGDALLDFINEVTSPYVKLIAELPGPEVDAIWKIVAAFIGDNELVTTQARHALSFE